jgi:hypothetical protein
VPVLVDPGIGKDKVKGCLAEAAPEAFLGIAKAHLARRLLGWAPSARVLVTAGLGPPLGGRTLRRVEQDGAWRTPFVPPERPAGTPAAIFFTSGSTGRPRASSTATPRCSRRPSSCAAVRPRARPGDAVDVPAVRALRPALGMTTVVRDGRHPACGRRAVAGSRRGGPLRRDR